MTNKPYFHIIIKNHFMKIRIYLMTLMLSIGFTLNAQDAPSDNKVTTLTEAMENIWSEQDEFTHVTKYYSKKTPKNQNDLLDRFFIFISVPENNEIPRLFLEVSHSVLNRQFGNYNYIKTIYLLSDDKTIELPVTSEGIIGNGTQHFIFTMGFGKKPLYFDFIKGMVNAKTTKGRLVTPKNLSFDFDISARERKAMNDVLTLWELMKK